MKIFVTSSVFFILIAIFSVKAQFISQFIDEDTISLGGIAARVKRAANLKNVNQLFHALSNAFEQIMGRRRQEASLGTANDLPTEIKKGGIKFKPRIANPLLEETKFKPRITNRLLEKADLAIKGYRSMTSKSMRGGFNLLGPSKEERYNKLVRKQPTGYRYREGLRRRDAPGCGVPLCTIVDMRIKSFKSMCHLTEWMTQNAKYQQVFEIQKGSCEKISK